MNVIVRAPNWVGDVAMSLPFLESLVNSPQIKNLYIYTRANLVPIFESLKFFDKIILIVENKKFAYIKNSHSIPKDINYAFILSPTFPATFPFFLKGIKNIFGLYSTENKFMISKGINTNDKNFRKKHLIHSYLSLLDFLDIKEQYAPPFFTFNEKTLEKFRLKPYEYFVIAPGARFGKSKQWALKNYLEISLQLKKTLKLTPVLVGVKKEVENMEGYKNISSDVYDLMGKTTLKEVINIIRFARFTIANDSGLMHLSYMNKTKTYAIFGSTSPLWTGPIINSTIFYSHRPCSPCFKRTCKYGHFGCLKDIEPNEVYTKIVEEYNETGGFFR